MYIESDKEFDTRPEVAIEVGVHRPNSQASTTLEMEVIQRIPGGDARIKAYDAGGAVVTITVPQSVAEEIVFGDLSDVGTK